MCVDEGYVICIYMTSYAIVYDVIPKLREHDSEL